MRVLLFSTLFFFAACNSGSRDAARGQTLARQAETPRLEIYTYGLPHFEYEQSRQRVARQWGFSYRSIAGCVVTEELVDSAARHNGTVEAELTRLHGANWKARFEMEVEAAYVADTLTRSIVFDNPIILAASRSLDSQGKGLMIEPQGASPDGRGLQAVAYTYDKWEGRQAYIVLHDLRVDTASRTASVSRSERRLFQYVD